LRLMLRYQTVRLGERRCHLALRPVRIRLWSFVTVMPRDMADWAFKKRLKM